MRPAAILDLPAGLAAYLPLRPTRTLDERFSTTTPCTARSATMPPRVDLLLFSIGGLRFHGCSASASDYHLLPFAAFAPRSYALGTCYTFRRSSRLPPHLHATPTCGLPAVPTCLPVPATRIRITLSACMYILPNCTCLLRTTPPFRFQRRASCLRLGCLYLAPRHASAF